MAYLSLFTVGVTRLLSRDWNTADEVFTDTLSQAEEHVLSLNQSKVYFYRGIARFLKSSYSRENYYLSKHYPKETLATISSAISDLTKATELEPEYEDPYVWCAFVYYNYTFARISDRPAYTLEQQVHDLNLAIAYASKAIAIDQNRAYSFYIRGQAYSLVSSFDDAIRDFTRAIELNPNDPYMYVDRATGYFFQGKHDLVIADYDKAISLKPDYPEAYHARGLFYCVNRDYTRGMSDLNRAIELRPTYIQAYIDRGIQYKVIGQENKANEDFRIGEKLIQQSDASGSTGNK
jgi:tetratricopeptide (TPR) repeat protein